MQIDNEQAFEQKHSISDLAELHSHVGGLEQWGIDDLSNFVFDFEYACWKLILQN